MARLGLALLRPISDVSAQDRIRNLILEAYAEHEERAALAADQRSEGRDGRDSRRPRSLSICLF